jgi:hypothetical protein
MPFDFSEYKSLVPIKYSKKNSFMTNTNMGDIEVTLPPLENEDEKDHEYYYAKFKELNKNTSYFKRCVASGIEPEHVHKQCAMTMVYYVSFCVKDLNKK